MSNTNSYTENLTITDEEMQCNSITAATNCLIKLGFNAKYAAFNYLRYIIIKYRSFDIINITMKELYSEIGKEFGVSEKGVQKNMGTLFQKTWNNHPDCYFCMLAKIVGNKFVPTLKEGISLAISWYDMYSLKNKLLLTKNQEDCILIHRDFLQHLKADNSFTDKSL